MPFPIEIILFIFLIAIAVVIARMRDLFAAAMLTGIFSLLSAALFTVMDAVDVAFTEAAVGAGVSVVFFLGTLSLTSKYEYNKSFRVGPLLIVLLMGGVLFYGTLDMPHYGDRTAPAHEHLAAKFIDAEANAFHAHHGGEAGHETSHGDDKLPHAVGDIAHDSDHFVHQSEAVGLQNMVTSILGSYRSYDTFGETTVIFTGVIGVMMLLRSLPRQKHVDPVHVGESVEGAGEE